MFSFPIIACFILLLTFISPSFSSPPINPKGSDHGKDPGLYSFVTRPDLRPSDWEIEILEPDLLSPGYWFVGPYENLDESKENAHGWIGPHIYDQSGELIWSGAAIVNDANADDFRLSNVKGTRRMTYISHDEGSGMILDDHFNASQKISMDDPDSINTHELNFVDNGTRAIFIKTRKLLAPEEESKDVKFPYGRCRASYDGFEEVDVATGDVTFSWSSQGHIALNQSTFTDRPALLTCRDTWDFVHFNSVDKTPEGDYLVSSRHTDTIFKVSAKDGSIVWRLGGVSSDFDQGNFVFSRQHNIRFRSQNDTHMTISFLDNAKGMDQQEPTHPNSRALIVALQTTTTPMKAEIIQSFDHPDGPGTYAPRRGNIEYLPNGNVFISWSEQGRQSEHSPNGTLVMKARLQPDWLGTYRAYKFDDFIAKPSEQIAVVARYGTASGEEHDAGLTRVWVSWNGAVGVETWNLYEVGEDGTVRAFLTSAPRRGFETVMETRRYAEGIVVQAVAGTGEVLGASVRVEVDGTEIGVGFGDEGEVDEEDEDGLSAGERLKKDLMTAMHASVSVLGNPITEAFLAGVAGILVILFALWWVKRRGVGVVFGRGRSYAAVRHEEDGDGSSGRDDDESVMTMEEFLLPAYQSTEELDVDEGVEERKLIHRAGVLGSGWR